ncbi:MAG: 16S rRNA (uracil(1498)-N(3))-methyltransferase [Telluria sp.]
MPRFYCPSALAEGALVELPEATARHLQVLRMMPGDPLDLFDGRGGVYRATLASLDKKRAAAAIAAFDPVGVELPFAVTLAQGLPEGSKMDWIVEKAVELGVASVQPLAAQRSVVRLAGERADKRRAHWEAVVVAASEQCGRNRLAQVAPVEQFERWITAPAQVARILLSPRGTQSLAAWAASVTPQDVVLMIGPEGGFSDAEEELAIAQGALALSMGPRVLRTETAGLAALACLSALWGGM